MKPLEIIPILNLPVLTEEADIVDLILDAAGDTIKEGDILIVSHTFLSKCKGDLINIESATPSKMAEKIAKGSELYGKLKNPLDPRHVQIILDQSKRVVRAFPYLITETRNGIVCAHAGVDQSNVGDELCFISLPADPDLEAAKIRAGIDEKTGKKVAVIIADSQGRPFREGSTGIAVGIAGIQPIRDFRSQEDLYGRRLRHKRANVADELVSAAQIVMGEAAEGRPAVIIRNYDAYDPAFCAKQEDIEAPSIMNAVRSSESDLFRVQHPLDFIKSRRSYKREFLDKKVPDEVLKKAAEIIKYAPSAHNSQPWRYYAIENDKTRETLVGKMGAKWMEDLQKDGLKKLKIKHMLAESRYRFLSAPHFMIVALKTNSLDEYDDDLRNSKEYILGVQSVASSIIYYCMGLKYHRVESCWYSAGLFAGDVIKEFLELPNDEYPQAVLLVGYGKNEIGEDIIPPKPARLDSDVYFKTID
mgnify:CR=1 FL=1